LNASNELVSIVAITKDNELAGHTGMIYDPELPGVCEMGIAMVRPKFRGYKLLEKMSARLLEGVVNLGIPGMIPQGNYPVSRLKRCEGVRRVGFSHTGLQFRACHRLEYTKNSFQPPDLNYVPYPWLSVNFFV